MPIFLKYRLKKMFDADAPQPDADRLNQMAERLGLAGSKRLPRSWTLVNAATAAAFAAAVVAIAAAAVWHASDDGGKGNVPASAFNDKTQKTFNIETNEDDCVFCLVDEEDVENALLGMESDNMENVVAHWQGRLSN